MSDPETTTQARYIADLTREAEGYAAVGRTHRLDDVNAELKRLGAPAVKGPTKPAAASTGRGATNRQTR